MIRMRIHGNEITAAMVRDAARVADVGLYRNAAHGSRKRARAFDVILEGTGRTGTRYGQNNDMVAATWDEWGIFLNALFEADSTITAPPYYTDADHFHWATGHRFFHLDVRDQHIRHRWDYAGTAVTGAYSVRKCTCGALSRFLLRGTWADFSADSMA